MSAPVIADDGVVTDQETGTYLGRVVERIGTWHAKHAGWVGTTPTWELPLGQWRTAQAAADHLHQDWTKTGCRRQAWALDGEGNVTLVETGERIGQVFWNSHEHDMDLYRPYGLLPGCGGTNGSLRAVREEAAWAVYEAWAGSPWELSHWGPWGQVGARVLAALEAVA